MKLLIVGVIIVLIIAVSLSFIQRTEIVWIDYEIQRGDTLWHIVTWHNPNANRQKLIYMTKERNGIGSIIQPGDIIEIPVIVSE